MSFTGGWVSWRVRVEERRHLRAAVGRSGSSDSRRRRTLGDAGVGDGGDVGAANGIIDRYADLQVGIADVSLVVIAARYQTTRLLIFDERHLRQIAPL